jgi:serine/threonine protein kinase
MIKDERLLEELGFLNSDLIDAGVRIYKAETKDSKNPICLKVIPSKYFKKEEYEISLKLKGKAENLVVCNNMYEFFKENLVILNMEYMNGGDLKTYIDTYNGYLSEKQIFSFVKQISF